MRVPIILHYGKIGSSSVYLATVQSHIGNPLQGPCSLISRGTETKILMLGPYCSRDKHLSLGHVRYQKNKRNGSYLGRSMRCMPRRYAPRSKYMIYLLRILFVLRCGRVKKKQETRTCKVHHLLQFLMVIVFPPVIRFGSE